MSNPTDTVWAICAGEYSDRVTLCALRTEEDATALAARMGGDLDIEPIALVSVDVQPKRVLHMITTINDDLTEGYKSDRIEQEWPFHEVGGTPDIAWSWRRFRRGFGELHVWGMDFERVAKVYSERRALVMTDDAFRAQDEAHS